MKYKWNNPSGNIVTLKISKNAWYKKYNLNGFVNLNKYKNNIKILHKKILLIFIAIIIIFFLYIQ